MVMKIKKAVAFLLALAILFTGCESKKEYKKNKETETITAVEVEEEIIEIEATTFDENGSEIDPTNGDYLEYTGETLKIIYRIKNTSKIPLEISIAALMDNKLQKFMISGDKTEKMSTKIVLSSNEEKKIEICFTPEVVYADKPTLFEILMYSTKGKESLKKGVDINSTYYVMGQIPVFAASKLHERISEELKEKRAETYDYAEYNEEEMKLGVFFGNKENLFTDIVENKVKSSDNIYVAVSTKSKEIDSANDYIALVFVDGELISLDGDEYSFTVDRSQKAMGYYRIDKSNLPKSGEHVITAMLVRADYLRDEDTIQGILLQRAERVLLGAEVICRFEN